MKKTLIAMGVAAAVVAPIASADTSVSGKVEQTMTWTDSTTGATDELTGGTDALLVFKGSEDLGNGMSAFADIRLDLDSHATDVQNDGNTIDTQTTFDTKVGISGGFGTVVMGRMEDFTESKVNAMVDVLAGSSIEIDDVAGRQDDGIAYVSPEIVPGLTVGVAAFYHDDNTAGEDIEDLDATDIALMYSNGPLAINVAQEEIKDPTGGDDAEATSVGVGYTIGDLKLAGVYQSIDNLSHTAANDQDNMMAAAVYTMGANSIAVGWNEDEQGTGATDNSTSAFEVRHNFSSRTRAYVGLTSDDFATPADETDTFYIGMEHSF